MKPIIERENGVKIYIVGCLIISLMCAFGSGLINKIFEKAENKSSIKDDFYVNINNDIIENHQLESDKEYWSLLFTETQDNVDDKVKGIVKEIISKKGTYQVGTDEYKICKLYESIVNQENSTKKLDTYIESIDNSKSIDELMNNLARIDKELSLGIFINSALQNDYKDNTQTIVAVAPFSFDYGNIYSDYYTNPLYSSYVATYIEFDREIFKIYGYNDEEAKESVRKISRFYTEIAKNSKPMEELTEVQSFYNIVTKNELKDIFSNINIDKFIDYNNQYNISIVDEKQARSLNSYLTMENLETLKECIKLQILQNYGKYADIEYYNLMNELEAKLTGTDITKDTIEDYAADVIALYFDSEISQEYIKKYANDNSINEFKQIINDIIAEYKIKIRNNDWLSEKTKQKALLKLENMKVNVGYPDKWEDSSQKYNLNDNLLDNIINMNRVNVEFANNSIINKEKYWIMSSLTVNAYYNPQDNSINFPIALLDYELYNESNSYYQNLGSFGSIIAHEITHAFDKSICKISFKWSYS
ncbi:MAG: M13 family metallopeptidase [Clostridia bacterium]